MELIKNLHLNKMVYWIDLNMFSNKVLILFSFTINVSTSFKNKIVYLKKWQARQSTKYFWTFIYVNRKL